MAEPRPVDESAAGLLDLPLHELSVRLHRGEVSSREATLACLEAIERLRPVLNAFIHIEADAALAQADAADREIAQGRIRGPLHGVPLAHKDVFFRRGRRSTCGSKIRETFQPETTATVIERLDSAGAVDLGGLNLAEFCVGPTGHNDYFGHCRNPWNTSHVSGGSSSGSGCAVASRQIFGSLGSDTGGSIRLPAGMCGVVGLKPTHGRVSLYGAMPRCWSLDVFGPLARTVEDAAILLEAIAGYDARDPWSRAVEVPQYTAALGRGVAKRRIAVPRNHLYPQLPPELRAVHDRALADFEALGASLVPVDMPDPEELYRWTTVINRVEASYIHKDWIRTRRADYNMSTITRIADGFDVSALDYIEALERRDQANERFVREVFGRCDVLYCPLLLIDVPTIAETDIRTEASAPAIVHRVTQATRWVSYVGLPVLTLPVGFSAGGLPVAAQLIGPRFAEETLFTFGHAYQGATAWHKRKPPNSA
jgi:aspartyl-tRNA(Asn)/glutamyl-tRNA(Gln) amidotransferase subunit A